MSNQCAAIHTYYIHTYYIYVIFICAYASVCLHVIWLQANDQLVTFPQSHTQSVRAIIQANNWSACQSVIVTAN